MRIGVTGGSGAIGQYVCDELMQEGHEVTSLDLVPPSQNVNFRAVDLTVLTDTCQAVQGCDQIIHLAAIPDPFGGHTPEEIISLNTTLSYNVFEAAKREDVPRVIYGCSESSTGFGIHEVKLTPRYLPIDEEHELWPHETYSLSKYIGERIGAKYAKAYGLEVISLRYTAVWLQRVADYVHRIVDQARLGTDLTDLNDKDGMGAYIAVRDVARACAAAVRYQFGSGTELPFEPFFLSARNTFFSLPTLEVMQTVFGSCPPVKDKAYFKANPYACVFDIRKAQRMLGWRPQLDWREYEQWEM